MSLIGYASAPPPPDRRPPRRGLRTGLRGPRLGRGPRPTKARCLPRPPAHRQRPSRPRPQPPRPDGPRELIALIDDLGSRGIGFKVLSSMDTTTPAGRTFLQIQTAFAKMERNVIRQRVHERVKAALARGCKGGRPLRHLCPISSSGVADSSNRGHDTLATEPASLSNSRRTGRPVHNVQRIAKSWLLFTL